MTETSQGKMESLGEAPGTKTARQLSSREEENQLETSHNKSLLIAEPRKPCQRTRAIVKGQTGKRKSFKCDKYQSIHCRLIILN